MTKYIRSDRILRPESNCWVVEDATRASILAIRPVDRRRLMGDPIDLLRYTDYPLHQP